MAFTNRIGTSLATYCWHEDTRSHPDETAIMISGGIASYKNIIMRRGKMNEPYGIGLGTSTHGEKIVTQVRLDGIAYGKLNVGDVIFTINGENADEMTHDEAVFELTSGLSVVLEIERISGSSYRVERRYDMDEEMSG